MKKNSEVLEMLEKVKSGEITLDALQESLQTRTSSKLTLLTKDVAQAISTVITKPGVYVIKGKATMFYGPMIQNGKEVQVKYRKKPKEKEEKKPKEKEEAAR